MIAASARGRARSDTLAPPCVENIRTLFNFDPPVTPDEVRAASLQLVRKITGFTKPSKANDGLFLAAVDEVTGVSMRLLGSLETNAATKNREEEAAKAKARAAKRFSVKRASSYSCRWFTCVNAASTIACAIDPCGSKPVIDYLLYSHVGGGI